MKILCYTAAVTLILLITGTTAASAFKRLQKATPSFQEDRTLYAPAGNTGQRISVTPSSAAWFDGNQLMVRAQAARTTIKITNLSGKSFALLHTRQTINTTFALSVPQLKKGIYLLSVYNAENGDLLLAQRLTR